MFPIEADFLNEQKGGPAMSENHPTNGADTVHSLRDKLAAVEAALAESGAEVLETYQMAQKREDERNEFRRERDHWRSIAERLRDVAQKRLVDFEDERASADALEKERDHWRSIAERVREWRKPLGDVTGPMSIPTEYMRLFDAILAPAPEGGEEE